MTARRRINVVAGVLGLLFATVLNVPALLAFPYQAQVGSHIIRSERPIPAGISHILAVADARVATSPIAVPGMGGTIYLTDGGWRWRLLSMTASGAFGFSRPISETIVINNSDIAADRVTNGAMIAGERSLSGTIAHEMTHGLIRRHFGLLADVRYPAWLREGYCDHVAGGGSLSDAAAATLLREGRSAPALTYYLGRKRVERVLVANGGSVDRLFASAG